jgi:cell division protein FtsW (lipid II flippase)
VGQSDKIDEYIAGIGDQIRWKRARGPVAEELRNHVMDQRDAFIAQGMDEDAATERAVLETGDAADVGLRLDRVHRPKPQWGMLGFAALLVAAGFLLWWVMFPEEDYYTLGARAFAAILGFGAMSAVYLADFTLLGRFPRTVFTGITAMAFLTACFSPSFFALFPGLRFPLPGFLLAVMLFPLGLALLVYVMRGRGYWGLIISIVALMFQALIAFFLLYTGSGAVHSSMAGMVIIGAAVHKKWFGIKKTAGFAALASLPILGTVYILFSRDYRVHRLFYLFEPGHVNEISFMSNSIRNSLMGSKLLGQSGHESGGSWLPLGSNPDYMLLTVVNKLGWIPYFAIIAALGAFAAWGLSRCLRQKSGLGLFVSLACVLSFITQTLVYIVFNLGFIAAAPFSLPLLSHGNTSLVINLAMIGLMLSVFRTGDIVRDGKEAAKRRRRVKFQDGKLSVDINR